MSPEQQPQDQPQPTPPQPAVTTPSNDTPDTTSPTAVAPPKKTRKYFWPIILMVGPTMVLIISLLLYAISNFIFLSIGNPEAASGDDARSLFATTPHDTIKTFLNMALFSIGSMCILFGPISFIVGIILLVKSMNKK